MESVGKEFSTNDVRVWTIGHSTRGATEFRDILLENEIATLVDVRSYPSSRRLPHFNQQTLEDWLRDVKIQYLHLPSLGGRRKPKPNSRNIAWHNPSFRAYADYMETEAFGDGVRELIELAREGNTAIMCAEALWWRCHRSLISDYLKSIGVDVIHIMARGKTEPHRYTGAASIVNGVLSYEGLLAGPTEDG